MENSPTIITDRLVLRRWREADAAAAHALLSDPVVNRFLPWWPTTSEEEALEFLRERYLSTYNNPIGYRYAVCLRGTDTPIGYVNVDPGPAHDLGYGIDRAHQNQGLITEAARAVTARVREDAALPFLTATHDRENPASGAVMRKLGMVYQYSYEELVQPKQELVVFRLYQMNLADPDMPAYPEYWNRYENHFVEDIA